LILVQRLVIVTFAIHRGTAAVVEDLLLPREVIITVVHHHQEEEGVIDVVVEEDLLHIVVLRLLASLSFAVARRKKTGLPNDDGNDWHGLRNLTWARLVVVGQQHL
jgi:hypothetical protein